ncbi:hypothetical protein FRC11_004245 [Ceratobasidium sp. 423]|nr:hypothetical protein FRC11_004245 [Ceratobasidium sp. 423]
MPITCRSSSPVKRGFPSVETWSTTQTTQTYVDLQSRSILQNVGNTVFPSTYLNGGSLNLTEWSLEEQGLVSELKCAGPKQEESLYTGRASLLRLLNSISERVFKSMNANRGEALVFYSGRNCKVQSPFTKQHHSLHIVALWEAAQVFPTIEYSNARLPDTTWCALATIGEAKVAGKPKYDLASHLRHHLQFHPELNAVLGFTVWPSGYGLFYHDAEVIHQSDFSWQQPGPLYAFVEKLYTQPFRDTSMQMLNTGGPDPVWATKIGEDVYVSEAPRPQAAPGQRRYITVAKNATTGEVVFLKDIWRDTGRRFFEGLLLKQAHEGENLSGLMMAKSHGYVLDESGKQIRTTSLDSLEKQAGGRFKMRMITRDVGRPLEEVSSLRHFLCVIYDACAVQRNLYRKCGTLHRDISDGNIMLAPDTGEYRERCANGYAEVKFVNQVLAKGQKCDPNPACLVIDLGNGADLKIERSQEVLRERTGTPKFIARSVSFGGLLDEEDFENTGVEMPSMEGPLGEYGRFMHTSEYLDLNSPVPDAESEVKFAHQLFHDAESTFWVIAWTLARSAKPGYKPESNPHANFCRFFHTMYTHYPVPGDEDPRSNYKKALNYWKSILHADLEILGPMLNKMFIYIRPEWAHRPELNPEHVHEALMRLLLAEIVRIDENDADVPLAIGIRSIPPPPPGMPSLPLNSMSSSFNSSTSLSWSSYSTVDTPEPQHNNLRGARLDNAGPPNQQNDIRLAEPPTPVPSHHKPQSTTGPNGAAEHASEDPGISILRQRGTCNLLEPTK